MRRTLFRSLRSSYPLFYSAFLSVKRFTTVFFLFYLTSINAIGQEQTTTNEAPDGTYQIHVPAIIATQSSTPLSDDDLQIIESKRHEDEDVTIELHGLLITIMSRASMEEGQRWPKFIVKGK